eukprot:4338143-Prymnesium_polylepis.1
MGQQMVAPAEDKVRAAMAAAVEKAAAEQPAPSTPALKRKWTDDEDASLKAAVDSVGEKWQEVSERVPGRNLKQCRDRWKSLAVRQRVAFALATTDAVVAEAGTEYVREADAEAEHVEVEAMSVSSRCSKSPLCSRRAGHQGICNTRDMHGGADYDEARRILKQHGLELDKLDSSNLAPLVSKRTQTGYVGVYQARKDRFQAQLFHRAIGARARTLHKHALSFPCCCLKRE